MKQKMKFTYILLFLSFCIPTSQAQEAINASGGTATGNGGSITYTVGQIAYHAYTGADKTLTEGVQQPYEISLVTAIENTEGITLKYRVYPNPTSGLITLAIKPYDYPKMRYQLYDQNGILLLDNFIVSEKTQISLVQFYPAAYFLKVISGNIVVKVFKIIKN